MSHGILTILSWLYGAAVAVRNAAFEAGLLRQVAVGVPVLSVGNMTAGGTGKTPLVEYLVRRCLERGRKVAVVSRGYGRVSSGVVVVSDGIDLRATAAEGGDEPVQVARKFPRVIVVVGERRVHAAQIAVKKFGADVVVMDDGFQHRYLRRNLDIVVVHGGRKLSEEPLLPLGRRREPLRALGRSGFVVVSRVADGTAMQRAMGDLSQWYHGAAAAMYSEPDGILAPSGEQVNVASLHEGTGFAFCGIGDPEEFLLTLKALGIRITAHAWFPDHHPYTAADLKDIISKSTQHGASFLITTEKDHARLNELASLKGPAVDALPLYHLRIAARIVEGEQDFLRAVDRCLTPAAQR